MAVEIRLQAGSPGSVESEYRARLTFASLSQAARPDKVRFQRISARKQPQHKENRDKVSCRKLGFTDGSPATPKTKNKTHFFLTPQSSRTWFVFLSLFLSLCFDLSARRRSSSLSLFFSPQPFCFSLQCRKVSSWGRFIWWRP